MGFILLTITKATSGMSVTDISLPIMVVAELVVFVGLLVGMWSTLKNKTTMNAKLYSELKEKLNTHMADSERQINSLRQNHSEAYSKLENKISGLEKEVGGIAIGIANIEGFMKAMSTKSKNDNSC
jgi:hypothetical protein